MILTLLAAVLLAPPAGTYQGGTGTGEDHIVVLKSDGTGTWHFHGCFSEADWKLTWKQTGRRISLKFARPANGNRRRDSLPPRLGESNYVSATATYEVRTFGSDAFLIPGEALARFSYDGRRGLIVSQSDGRGPYLRLQPVRP